jgi:hypothetical protein
VCVCVCVYIVTKLDQIIAVEEKIVVGVELPELAVQHVKVLVGKVVQHLVTYIKYYIYAYTNKYLYYRAPRTCGRARS